MPVQSRIYNISSSNYKFINNTTKLSDGIWSFPNLNLVGDDILEVYISILHAELPNTDYVVNEYNNILKVNDFLVGNLTFTLTNGNYNINTFITMFNSIATNGYTLSYSSLTNKLTLTAPNSFSVLTSQSSCIYILGLGNSNFNSVGLSATFPFCINLLPTSVFSIKSSTFNIGNFGADNSADIFLTIQNNGSNGSRCLYSNYSGIKYKLDNPNLSVFDIKIVDEHSNLVNFNGVDWSITFQLDILFRDKEPLPKFENLINSVSG
jgi:hypothetical protein